MPTYASALGKVLLAGLSEDQAENFLRAPLPKFTAKTETDPRKVRKLLQEVRRKGFAVESGEEHQGVGCVGAPVKDTAGRWIAAMSISGPLQGTPFRMGQAQIGLLLEKAEELSLRMSSAGDAGHGMFSLA